MQLMVLHLLIETLDSVTKLSDVTAGDYSVVIYYGMI